MKILVICLYFGKLPNYFGYFLKSCEQNNNMNWLIYTDDSSFNGAAPQNVTIRNTTFEDMRDRIQKKLDCEISLERPYRLCDYKVAYGDIFENELSCYDYWGHCDLDVIFGDTRKFITEDLLRKYSKLFLYGCFSLIKNEYKTNKAYQFVYDDNNGIKISYKDIFAYPEMWGFDEMNGLFDIHKIFDILNLPYYETSEHIADVDSRYKNFLLTSDRNFIRNRIFEWTNGELYDRYIVNDQLFSREYALCHFSARSFQSIQNFNGHIRSFIITPTSFAHDYNILIKENVTKYSELPNNNALKDFDPYSLDNPYTKESHYVALKSTWKKYLKMKGQINNENL